MFEREAHGHPREVILIDRQGAVAQRAPRRLENRMIVLEVSEISDFFEEFVEAIPLWKRRASRRQANIDKVLKIFRNANEADVATFLEDSAWRRTILSALAKYEIEFIRDFEQFLNKAVDLNRRQSRRNGAFHEYAKGLDMSMDVLNSFKCDAFPPALLAAVVRNLDRLANYIGDGLGNSFAASRLWSERKVELSKEMIAELLAIALCHRHQQLIKLLEEL